MMNEIDNKQVRILIVDNSPEILLAGRDILEKEEYDVYIAEGGEPAVELACAIDFDLIILDMHMPSIDGFETLAIFKQNEHTRDIPVILLTEKLDIDSMVRGFELGAADYLRKPFNELEMIARVRNHVLLKKMREELYQKDISLKEAYSLLEITVTTDPLTNLFNRREIINRLENEQVRFKRSKRPFSIVIAEIDCFSNISDTYGKRFSDYIIISLSETLQNMIRKQDSLSRLGAAEFMLILPETDTDGARAFAEKLRSNVQDLVFIKGDNEAKITMTFGISTCDSLSELDDLLERADKALRKGKQSGRNCVMTA
ncbi:MAG: diguanylate cyclase [Clostridiales bacterium]|nr:diguanylate cyclase [Clostridiales bacterium]